MLKHILPLIPPHQTYVEVFGGSGAVMFAKEPSNVEVFNDIDHGMINFFRVLRDPEKFDELVRKCAMTPYSREEYLRCREEWEVEDEIERAYRWYVVASWSFSGRWGASISFSVSTSSRGMAAAVSKWLSSIENLPEVHERLMRVLIENLDFRVLIETYDSRSTFFYLDPPYVHSTRTERAEYQYEMSDQDHLEMVGKLLEIDGMALVSGYDNEHYRDLELNGWTRQVFGSTTTASLTKDNDMRRVESLWLCPRTSAAIKQPSLF